MQKKCIQLILLIIEKCCLSSRYNGAYSYLFVNGTEIIKFKAKYFRIFCFKFNNICTIIACPLCLGNISKDWSVDSMKDTGLNGYVHDFSVDYNAVVVDDIKDIQKHLMKKNNIAR